MIINDIAISYLDTPQTVQDKILTKLGTKDVTVSIEKAALNIFNQGPGIYDDVEVTPIDDIVDVGVRETLERRLALFKRIESELDEKPSINVSKIKEQTGEIEIKLTSKYVNVFQEVQLSPFFPLIASEDKKVRVYDSSLESLLRSFLTTI